MSIPENHVVAEGRTLRAAIEAAAEQLSVPVGAVAHKLDMAHFRNAGGGVTGADTVKIFAWAKDPGQVAAALDAETWVKGLVAEMGKAGTVRADQRGDTVHVYVDVADGARHLVGRGGATLRAIQHLLEASVGERYPGVSFRIDIARGEDDRPPRRDDERPRREDDRPRRDDRGGDRGPPRRDRDDRPPRRDDRGGDRRDRGGDRRNDPEELKRLARKLARKVQETGEPEIVRKELNSYDRRLVHVEVGEVPGVKSRSIGEGVDRRIEIYRVEDDGTDDEPTAN